MSAPVKDLTGMRFDRLVVLRRDVRAEYTQHSPGARWVCQCDCGNFITVHGNNLRRKNTRSCGCLRVETATANGKANQKNQ